MIKISYIKSDDRIYNIERCLSLIKSEITSRLRNANRAVVKPFCLSEDFRAGSTHIAALHALLSFIKPFSKGQLVLAGNVHSGKTINAFKTLGYLEIQDEFDFEIVDLNDDEMVLPPGSEVPIAKTLLDADYIISLTPPRAFSSTSYFGAIANLADPSKQSINDRPNFLREVKSLFQPDTENSFLQNKIASSYLAIKPQLAVIDGYELTEGGNPPGGNLLPSHFAITSTNFVAADWLCANLMQLELDKIDYFSTLGAENEKVNYFVIGDDWQKNLINLKFSDHSRR